MEMSKFRPVVFEEGFYTLKEAIEKISDVFNIALRKGSDRTNYKNIYQRLWRELGAMELTEGKDIIKESKRKTKYSHTILNTVINQGLYSWLCQVSKDSEYQEFTEWKNRAKNYRQKYEQIMATEDQIDIMEQSSAFNTANAVEVEFQRRRLGIALDFIFSHFIELDESLLRADLNTEAELQRRRLEIALDFIFSHFIELDENLLRADIDNDFGFDEAAPSAYSLMVNERLMDNKNYYTIKKGS